MEALSTVNKTLVEKNANLNSTMQRVTNQYQVLSNQMKDVEAKCNKEKTNAYEQCYLMVSENKKKQWCVVCQEPGTGRYYCSNECEEYYWSVAFSTMFLLICDEFCGFVAITITYLQFFFVLQEAKTSIVSN